MLSLIKPFLLLCLLFLVSNSVLAQTEESPEYDVAFIGPRLSDPLMQQNKETYVIYGCAYCHGLNLQPVGEAPDLRESFIVGTDVDANIVGPLLRRGIPQTAKSSPMPQYSDLSDREIKAITSYIHYERARARFENLSSVSDTAGDDAAGRNYFDQNCVSCHLGDKGLAGIGDKIEGVDLRKQVLWPEIFRAAQSFNLDQLQNVDFQDGRKKHQVLLENYVEQNVDDLLAYLRSTQ